MENFMEQFQWLMGLNVSYMPEVYKDDIFHYTSSNGFNSILFNKNEMITLWASRFDCQNDVTEGKIAQLVFHEVCDEMRETGEINKELYETIYNVAPTRTHLFIRFDKKGQPKFSRPECDRYITCFSKNKDSLAMWNYYSKGNKYEGFNIGFSPEQIKSELWDYFKNEEVDIKMYQIIYEKQTQKDIIRKLLLKLDEVYEKKLSNQIRCYISNQLYDWSLVFKSEYFQHEEEVRIIVYVAKRTKNGILQKGPMDVQYRNNYGLTIPYISLNLDKKILKSVGIGPLYCDNAQKENQKNIMYERLSYNGYEDIKIEYSNVPIRF